MLKSEIEIEIEIAQVLDRLPERIKAHASLCFMTLMLYRVMRACLKLAGHEASPESALAHMRRIQRHTVSIDAGAAISGISGINQEQAGVLAALTEGQADLAEREAYYQRQVAASYARGKAINMATHLEIDGVIDPADTRRIVAETFAALPARRPGSGVRRYIDAW